MLVVRHAVGHRGLFASRIQVSTLKCAAPAATFHTSVISQSGHNKWSKIKHDKAVKDVRKAKLTTKLVHAITTAGREAGAAYESDPRFQNAVKEAKSAGVKKDAITAAIMASQGKTADGKPLMHHLHECMVLGKIGLIMEATVPESSGFQNFKVATRKPVEWGKLQKAPCLFLFDNKGYFLLDAQSSDLEDVMEVALEHEAVQDVRYDEDEDSGVEIICDKKQFADVKKFLETKLTKFPLIEAELRWIPNPDTQVELESDSEEAKDLQKVLGRLEDEYEGLTRMTTNVKYK